MMSSVSTRLTRDTVVKSEPNYGLLHPREIRALMREGRFTPNTTRNVALGHVQCALVALPRGVALEFLVFCQRNQRACPVIEVTDVGSSEPRRSAPGAAPNDRGTARRDG